MTSRWAKSASRGRRLRGARRGCRRSRLDLGDVTDRLSNTSNARCSCPEDRVRAAGGRGAPDGHRAGSLWPCASPQTCSRRSAPTSACAATRPRASCSSRSSRAGSAATRSSARGRGSSPSRRPRARRAGRRLPRLRPRREARADRSASRRRPELPESRFVVAETLVRFDHGGGTAEVLAGDGDAVAARLEEELVFQKHKPPSQRSTMRRTPDRATYERAWSGSASTSAPGMPSRSCSRSGRSGRRPRPRSSSTARCGASTPRRTSSCSSSALSRSSAPRRRRSSSARTAARA